MEDAGEDLRETMMNYWGPDITQKTITDRTQSTALKSICLIIKTLSGRRQIRAMYKISFCYFLQVDIAEWSGKCAHQILDLSLRSNPTNIDIVIKCSLSTGRHVEESVCALHGILAVNTLLGVKHLPDPPDTVNHGVVQVESRITGRSEDISTGITAERIVAPSVDTNVTSAGNTLHLHLEVQNSLGLENVVKNRCSVSETLVDGVAEITLQTARVVVQRVGVGSDTAAGKVKSGRAQIDLHVLERTGLDAAATRSSGKVDRGETT